MATICPSLTYATAFEYSAYMRRLGGVTRLHIDVSDGVLAPVRLIGLPQVWWPQAVSADIHVMYQRPLEHTEQLVSMAPHLVIVHPEADGDLAAFAQHLHQFGIKFGIALMPDRPLASLTNLLAIADHALVFSGKIGYYGGHADPSRFEEVRQLKHTYPMLEIGWDGGANDSNVRAIADAGVDVINVGSGVSKSDDPAAAYAKLVEEVSN